MLKSVRGIQRSSLSLRGFSRAADDAFCRYEKVVTADMQLAFERGQAAGLML